MLTLSPLLTEVGMAMSSLSLAAAAGELNRDPLSHCRMAIEQRADSDRFLLSIAPTVVYRVEISEQELALRDVSEQTVLWEHQLRALEHFVVFLQFALDRTREALENRRRQERAL